MPKLYIRIMSYLTTVVVLSIIVGCTTGGGTVSDTEIIASWDDTAMTVADFKDKMYVRYSNESSAMKKEYEDRIKILDEYVVRALKIAEGYRLAFNEREDIQKSYNDAIERNASNLLYDDKVINSFVTGEMLLVFWEDYKYEVRCRHILITVVEVV